MKFERGNQYHEQIKLLHFGFLGEIGTEKGSGVRKIIEIDVNRFCGHVKQVRTPSE